MMFMSFKMCLRICGLDCILMYVLYEKLRMHVMMERF
jgi:hypothetical protein